MSQRWWRPWHKARLARSAEHRARMETLNAELIQSIVDTLVRLPAVRWAALARMTDDEVFADVVFVGTYYLTTFEMAGSARLVGTPTHRCVVKLSDRWLEPLDATA